jgi:RNA polymerase sigma-70 factor (ECF subfamily)
VRELLEEYVPRVYRFALRLTHDPHAAEDLTQETLLRAWRQRDLLRDPRAARVWLFRIAVNLWRDQVRRGRSLVARAARLEMEPLCPGPSPEHQVAQQEDVRRALEAVEELPERQRQVVYLRACEELSAEEIARVLDTNSAAVKANLCVARKTLRARLRDLVEDLFLVL